MVDAETYAPPWQEFQPLLIFHIPTQKYHKNCLSLSLVHVVDPLERKMPTSRRDVATMHHSVRNRFFYFLFLLFFLNIASHLKRAVTYGVVYVVDGSFLHIDIQFFLN